jgi:hypothetical protein
VFHELLCKYGADTLHETAAKVPLNPLARSRRVAFRT